MVPPERTLGPIGWKELFGDDEEPDIEPSTDAGSPAPEAAPGEEGGDRGAARPGESGDPGAGNAGVEGGEAWTDREATVSEPAPAGRSADLADVGDRIREERSRNARRFSGDDGSGRSEPAEESTRPESPADEGDGDDE
jgi:hypothetical protein